MGPSSPGAHPLHTTEKEFEVQHHNDNTKCICPGAICNCGAEGVVKDGHGVHRPAHMMDGTSTRTADQMAAMRDHFATTPEAARAKMQHDQRYSYLPEGSRPAFDMDAAFQAALADSDRTHAMASRGTGPGFTKDGRKVEDLSQTDRAYHDMMQRDSNAWQGTR